LFCGDNRLKKEVEGQQETQKMAREVMKHALWKSMNKFVLWEKW